MDGPLSFTNAVIFTIQLFITNPQVNNLITCHNDLNKQD